MYFNQENTHLYYNDKDKGFKSYLRTAKLKENFNVL